MRLRIPFVLLQAALWLVFTSCSESKEVRLQQFLLRVNIAWREGNPERAIIYFMKARKLDPVFLNPLNIPGTIHNQAHH